MSAELPLVTVAIPTFNRAHYLGKALRSALDQSYQNIEIVVFDNASTDATEQVVRKYSDPRIRYHRHGNNIGMMGNWNACLQTARGTYFLMLSDDDLLEWDAIEALVQPFLAPRNGASADALGMVYGRARLIDDSGQQTGVGVSAPAQEEFADLAMHFIGGLRPTYPCSILLRTADARDVGGYPGEDFPLAADAALWMKVVARRGLANFVDRPLVAYRSHASSVTRIARIDQWLADNTGVANLALSLMPSTLAATLAKDLHREVRRLNARVVCGLPFLAFCHGAASRVDVLSAVYRHARLFIDLGSAARLLVILGLLTLPRNAVEYLLRLRRRSMLNSDVMAAK